MRLWIYQLSRNRWFSIILPILIIDSFYRFYIYSNYYLPLNRQLEIFLTFKYSLTKHTLRTKWIILSFFLWSLSTVSFFSLPPLMRICARNLRNQRMLIVIESFVLWNELLMVSPTNAFHMGKINYIIFCYIIFC